MKTIERYILFRTVNTFVLAIAAMTGVVWATQALRQLDLVTAKGQTLLQFVYITSLALPFLCVIVAPFALMIALVVVLNALARDSELIVISASGAGRSIILKPVMVFALMIAGLMAYFALFLSPSSLATLREELTRVRVDLVANIVKPGRFIQMDQGLTFHIRNRTGDGLLEGLLLNDERDPEIIFTYTAERGQIMEIADKTLLVMLDGTIQRRPTQGDDISIVSFESYGFDLSAMIPEASEPTYKASERPTFELLTIDPNDSYANKNRDRLLVEFHDRMSIPLYPIAFALVAFALLGGPKTTRQSQVLSITMVIALCVLIRTAGFGATLIVSSLPSLFWIQYAVPLTAILLTSWAIAMGTRPRWLKALGNTIDNAIEKISARLSASKNKGAAS